MIVHERKSDKPHSSTVSNPMLKRQLQRREAVSDDEKQRKQKAFSRQRQVDNARRAAECERDPILRGGGGETLGLPSVQPGTQVSDSKPAGRVDKHQGARKRKKGRTLSDG